MTPNQNIFCNTPWYELHIYWDGSLGICCQESRKLYNNLDRQYNIATMSIREWFNSRPVQQFRMAVLGNQQVAECSMCYAEEDHGGVSRRIRSNQKSVIFTRTAFSDSLQQSPGYQHFVTSNSTGGLTDTAPIDIHIDLGNYCNLACKMCVSRASSTIAAQEVKWGIESSRQYLGTDWTRNRKIWDRFKQELLELPTLNNIHLMGGETLLTDRFEDLVDTMIEHRRFDVCFSFVTNGTTFNPALLDKLKQFRRVGIEISIETVDEHNTYVRQGTDTPQVLENIRRYVTYCNDTSITVTLRPAPSLLSIGYYLGLLEYALDNRLIVKSNLCYRPRFLHPKMLPAKVKQLYQQRYIDFLSKLDSISINNDYNASDPNNYQLTIKHEAEMCLSLLQTDDPDDQEVEFKNLVEHCQKWDKVYGYDARALYPEFAEILDRYGY